MKNAAHELNQLTADWERLGLVDPLWAVCVDASKKGGRWDYDEFLESGRAEVSAVMSRLDTLGPSDRPRTVALDFGCGAGRLSTALAGHFEHVVGVDISRSILDEATKRDRTGGRCIYLHNEHPDLRRFADRSFDLVYSSLVFQHMSRKLALGYVSEFFRVVRPEGLVILSLPTAPRWTLKAAVFKFAPNCWTRWIQTRFLSYPAPMRMNAVSCRAIESTAHMHGCRVLAALKGFDRSHDWHVVQFVIARGATESFVSGGSSFSADHATPHAPKKSPVQFDHC